MARIKVKVELQDGEVCIETGGRQLPPMQSIARYLSGVPEARRGALDRYSLQGVVECGRVSRQQLADALVLYYAAQEHDGEAEYPSPYESVGSDAFLTTGSTLYRLIPVEHVPLNKALCLIRAKAKAEARVVHEQTLQHASEEARVLITQAEERSQAIRDAANKVREELRQETARRVPSWVNRFVYFTSFDNMHILLNLSIVITAFRHGLWEWPALDAPFFKVLATVGVGINGEYVPDQCRLFLPPGTLTTASLPHMNAIQSCMALGDAPVSIHSEEDLRRLERAIASTFEIVNLQSLLSYNWLPEVRAFAPPEVVTWLDNRDARSWDVDVPPVNGRPIPRSYPWTI